MLEKETIYAPDGVIFHHPTQNSVQFELRNYLFLEISIQYVFEPQLTVGN